MRVVIQSRVSTVIQENRRQIQELSEYASKMGWEVVRVFEETISGAKKNEERPILNEMIAFIKSNNIDKVLCWELSRIGRSSLEVLKTIQLLNENCISLYIKNYNIETLNEKCEVNPLSQFMVQILTSVSEMERTQIRSRIKSGYDSYRKNGGKVGRKEGYTKDKETLLAEHKDVVKQLRKNLSVRDVMKITKKSSGTIQKIKKLMTTN
jgi:DNA invertase Pin-like site-specific DNA recombinase